MGYADAQEGAHSRTAFRSAEKTYKRYTHVSSSQSRNHRSRRAQVPATDVSAVLDFRKIRADGECSVVGVSRAEGSYDWLVYTIDKQPGFFFIPEALTEVEQLHWATQCLTGFPQPPNRTNHNALYGPIANLWAAFLNNKVLVEIPSEKQQFNSFPDSADIDSSESVNREQRETAPSSEIDVNKTDNVPTAGGEDTEEPIFAERNSFYDEANTTAGFDGLKCGSSWEFRDTASYYTKTSSRSVAAETLVRKLRWATVGIQFDWSKRAYNESLPYQGIPPKLGDLAAKLAKPAMEEGDFKAEAAIVNFYGPDDMLGGHVDDMEADMSKPIVSISLGCKAIFLLGGSSRDEPPIAMFVRSGDVVLMAGPARQCYHGVPRIFTEERDSELPDFTSAPHVATSQLKLILKFLESSRINVNIRQVH